MTPGDRSVTAFRIPQLRHAMPILALFLTIMFTLALGSAPARADFEKFKAIMIEALSKIDTISSIGPGDDNKTIIIKLKKPEGFGGSHIFYLGNAYREYLESPADLPEILEKYTGIIKEAAEQRAFSMDKLFTLLRPIDYLQSDDKKYIRSRLERNETLDWKDQSMAFELYVADMMISLVIDEGQRFSTVLSKDLTSRKLTLSDAVKRGMTNLTRLTAQREFIEINGVWHLSTVETSLTSSLLLHESYWRQKTKQFPKGMVAAIPARDVILVVEAGSISSLEKLTRTAQAIFDKTSHPQSAFLFNWKDGRWHAAEQFR